MQLKLRVVLRGVNTIKRRTIRIRTLYVENAHPIAHFGDEVVVRDYIAVDVLLDNLYLDEIEQAYRDVMAYLILLVSGRLEEVEKNVGKDDKKTL